MNPEDLKNKKSTTEEMLKALSGVASMFLAMQMSATVNGVPLPDTMNNIMDRFMEALPTIADTISVMDKELKIEAEDDKNNK